MSLWFDSSSPSSDGYELYRPAQREESFFPKYCNICHESLNPKVHEIVAKQIHSTRWNASHRSCAEKRDRSWHSFSPSRVAMESRGVQTELTGDSINVGAESIEPMPFPIVSSDSREEEATKPFPLEKIANGLREVTSGVWDAVRSNPGKVLLTGFAIAAVVGLGVYTAQELELRCVKGPSDGVAYCAEIPAGLTAEEKADLIFTKNIMEGQYYPTPDRETCKYSEIAGGEEFSSLAWTSYFGKRFLGLKRVLFQ